MAHCGVCGAPCAGGQICDAGACTAPTSNWQMFGATAAHTGHNATDVGVPPLSPAWSVDLANSELWPAVVEDGRVFVTWNVSFSAEAPIVALNLSDGSLVWSHNFGAVSRVGQPSVVGGKVYVENGKPISGQAKLWAIDSATGVPSWSSNIAAQWEQYWAPTIAPTGNIYVNGGSGGGLYGFDAAGSSLFFSNTLEQYDEWSPALDGGTVYTFVEGNLRAHDALTGAVSWTVTVDWNWAGWSMRTAPVIGAGKAFVIAPPDLHAVDLVTHTLAWTANGTYAGTPALAGGVVYGLSGGNLLARDAATGSLLWAFDAGSDLTYPPVVAAGHVYVASATHVHAVDIATHAEAWSAPVGGRLSIASSYLLVARADGVLRAFRMTH
jgi:outer membrane protein assembly factor BamB